MKFIQYLFIVRVTQKGLSPEAPAPLDFSVSYTTQLPMDYDQRCALSVSVFRVMEATFDFANASEEQMSNTFIEVRAALEPDTLTFAAFEPSICTLKELSDFIDSLGYRDEKQN